MTVQVNGIQLGLPLGVDLLILEAQIGLIRSSAAPVAYMDVRGQGHGILARAHHGDIEALVAQLHSVRHGDTAGGVGLTLGGDGALAEAVDADVSRIFIDGKVELVAGFQSGRHGDKSELGTNLLSRPDIFGELPRGQRFIACVHGDGSRLLFTGPNGHVAAVDEGGAGVHGGTGRQIVVAQIQRRRADALAAHAEAQGVHAVGGIIGTRCFLGLEGVNLLALLILLLGKAGQRAVFGIGSPHLRGGFQLHQGAFRNDQQLIIPCKTDAQAVECEAGRIVVVVRLSVVVDVIIGGRCLLGAPALGLGLLNGIHIPQGKPGPQAPGLTLRIIFG